MGSKRAAWLNEARQILAVADETRVQRLADGWIAATKGYETCEVFAAIAWLVWRHLENLRGVSPEDEAARITALALWWTANSTMEGEGGVH